MLSAPASQPYRADNGARNTPAAKFSPNAAVITSIVTATIRGPANRRAEDGVRDIPNSSNHRTDFDR
jgi:hypothetical protein